MGKVTVQETNVRRINEACITETYSGRVRVHLEDGTRIVRVRLNHGQLQAKCLGTGKWVDVAYVLIT